MPVINDNEDYKFTLDKGIKLKDGKSVTIVATGLCVAEALKASDLLSKENIDAEIINIHTIKPIDSEILIKSAKKTGRVVVVEEHSIIGGLGEAVASVLSENLPVPVLKIGTPDVYGHSASASELLDEFSLTGEKIAQKVAMLMR